MRTTVPPAFDLTVSGPEGRYTLSFKPTDEWDGIIDVTIGELAMVWDVDYVDHEAGGGLVLAGMTSGTTPIWNDQFWFELRIADTPPVIRYWGDRVLWREDRAV